MRGIKITKNGMEYNSSLHLPSAKKILDSLEEEINRKKRELEDKEKKIEELQKEVERLKEKKSKKEPNNTQKEEEEELKTIEIEDFKEFIDKTKSEYQKTSEPICNMVKGWQRETTFYINSYNKLSISTPNGDYMQLKNPREINKFWKWLYLHQNRVGDIVDFKKLLDAKEINRRYKGENLEIGDRKYTLYKVEDVKGGKVKITLKDKKGKIATISDKTGGRNKPLTYTPNMCEKIILSLIR